MSSELLLHYSWLIFQSCILYYAYRFVRFIWRTRKLGKVAEQFPMDERHWLKGHLHKLTDQGEKSLAYLNEQMKKYPKACGLYFINFLKPYVAVYHPDTVKVALKAAGTKTKGQGLYYFGKRWLGDGLIMSSGKKWYRNRRLLTPIFHIDALKHYVMANNQATDTFLLRLSEFARTKKTFEAQDFTSDLTIEILLRCAFSYEGNFQTLNEKHMYTKATDELLKLWVKRMFEPLKHFDFIYWRTDDGKQYTKYCDFVHNFANKLIKERRNLLSEHYEQAEKYHDFLDILLKAKDEDGTGLSDEEIKDEITNFVVAGYETTSSALSWFFYNMAVNPEHQKICQKEIDGLLEGRSDNFINWDDLQNIPYTLMCIKESLRMFGIPLIERELDEDIFIDGKLVPAGSSILVLFCNLHRNPAVWDNPSKFDPERFSVERIQDMDPFAFLPFSAGSRNCIGQAFAMEEMQIVVAKTLKRFSFSAKENHIPSRMLAMTLKSSNGIYLKVTERNENN